VAHRKASAWKREKRKTEVAKVARAERALTTSVKRRNSSAPQRGSR
jgi:hypothetical protein